MAPLKPDDDFAPLRVFRLTMSERHGSIEAVVLTLFLIGFIILTMSEKTWLH